MKTYKNITALLFSILVFTHTNVSYAHDFVNIDRIAYKEASGDVLESIAEKSDGSFRVDFSLEKTKIDGKEVKFIVVDNNIDGNEIGEIVSNSDTCNAVNVVSDYYPCSISVRFKSLNIDTIKSFVIRVVSTDNEDDILDKIEVSMPKLRASFKDSVRNVLVLKNLSSQDITITEIRSGGKVVAKEQGTKLTANAGLQEVTLDSSSSFFPVRIKYEYQRDGQSVKVKGNVDITGSTVAVNRAAYKEDHGATLESIAEKSDGSFRVDFSLEKAKIDGKEIKFIVVDNNIDGNEIGEIVSNSDTCNAVNPVGEYYPCSISVHFLKSQNIDTLESFVIRLVNSNDEKDILNKIEVKMPKLKAGFKDAASNILVLRNLSLQEITVTEMKSGGKVVGHTKGAKLTTKGEFKEVTLDSSSNFLPVKIKYVYQSNGQEVRGNIEVTGFRESISFTEPDTKKAGLQRLADEQAFTTNLGTATLADIENLRAEAVRLGKETELDTQKAKLQKSADEQAFTTNLGTATLADIENLRAEAVRLGKETELDTQKAKLQKSADEQAFTTNLGTATLANVEGLRAEAKRLGKETELDTQKAKLQKSADEQVFTTNLGTATLADIENLRAEAVRLGKETELATKKQRLTDEQKFTTDLSTATLADIENLRAEAVRLGKETELDIKKQTFTTANTIVSSVASMIVDLQTEVDDVKNKINTDRISSVNYKDIRDKLNILNTKVNGLESAADTKTFKQSAGLADNSLIFGAQQEMIDDLLSLVPNISNFEKEFEQIKSDVSNKNEASAEDNNHIQSILDELEKIRTAGTKLQISDVEKLVTDHPATKLYADVVACKDVFARFIETNQIIIDRDKAKKEHRYADVVSLTSKLFERNKAHQYIYKRENLGFGLRNIDVESLVLSFSQERTAAETLELKSSGLNTDFALIVRTINGGQVSTLNNDVVVMLNDLEAKIDLLENDSEVKAAKSALGLSSFSLKNYGYVYENVFSSQKEKVNNLRVYAVEIPALQQRFKSVKLEDISGIAGLINELEQKLPAIKDKNGISDSAKRLGISESVIASIEKSYNDAKSLHSDWQTKQAAKVAISAAVRSMSLKANALEMGSTAAKIQEVLQEIEAAEVGVKKQQDLLGVTGQFDSSKNRIERIKQDAAKTISDSIEHLTGEVNGLNDDSSAVEIQAVLGAITKDSQNDKYIQKAQASLGVSDQYVAVKKDADNKIKQIRKKAGDVVGTAMLPLRERVSSVKLGSTASEILEISNAIKTAKELDEVKKAQDTLGSATQFDRLEKNVAKVINAASTIIDARIEKLKTDYPLQIGSTPAQNQIRLKAIDDAMLEDQVAKALSTLGENATSKFNELKNNFEGTKVAAEKVISDKKAELSKDVDALKVGSSKDRIEEVLNKIDAAKQDSTIVAAQTTLVVSDQFEPLIERVQMITKAATKVVNDKIDDLKPKVDALAVGSSAERIQNVLNGIYAVSLFDGAIRDAQATLATSNQFEPLVEHAQKVKQDAKGIVDSEIAALEPKVKFLEENVVKAQQIQQILTEVYIAMTKVQNARTTLNEVPDRFDLLVGRIDAVKQAATKVVADKVGEITLSVKALNNSSTALQIQVVAKAIENAEIETKNAQDVLGVFDQFVGIKQTVSALSSGLSTEQAQGAAEAIRVAKSSGNSVTPEDAFILMDSVGVLQGVINQAQGAVTANERDKACKSLGGLDVGAYQLKLNGHFDPSILDPQISQLDGLKSNLISGYVEFLNILLPKYKSIALKSPAGSSLAVERYLDKLQSVANKAGDNTSTRFKLLEGLIKKTDVTLDVASKVVSEFNKLPQAIEDVNTKITSREYVEAEKLIAALETSMKESNKLLDASQLDFGQFPIFDLKTIDDLRAKLKDAIIKTNNAATVDGFTTSMQGVTSQIQTYSYAGADSSLQSMLTKLEQDLQALENNPSTKALNVGKDGILLSQKQQIVDLKAKLSRLLSIEQEIVLFEQQFAQEQTKLSGKNLAGDDVNPQKVINNLNRIKRVFEHNLLLVKQAAKDLKVDTGDAGLVSILSRCDAALISVNAYIAELNIIVSLNKDYAKGKEDVKESGRDDGNLSKRVNLINSILNDKKYEPKSEFKLQYNIDTDRSLVDQRGDLEYLINKLRELKGMKDKYDADIKVYERWNKGTKPTPASYTAYFSNYKGTMVEKFTKLGLWGWRDRNIEDYLKLDCYK